MANESYLLPETTYDFLASGGDVTFTCTSLAASAGRQSAQLDTGTTAKPYMYEWRAFCKFATTPVVGEAVDVYIKTGNGSHIDNDDGTGDAAVSAEDKLRNLTYIGSIIVDEASTTPEFSASGQISLFSRYIQVVFWNNTADAFSATAADHGFSLQEMTIQGQ